MNLGKIVCQNQCQKLPKNVKKGMEISSSYGRESGKYSITRPCLISQKDISMIHIKKIPLEVSGPTLESKWWSKSPKDVKFENVFIIFGKKSGR